MPTVALHTAPDGLLAVVAPLGCAAASRTALVIDLDAQGLPFPGTRTLRELVEDGPTAAELRPTRSGIACLPNGGISPEDAREVVDALVESWPRVVLRTPTEDDVPVESFGVAVRPLLPGIQPSRRLPTLLQPLGLTEDMRAPDGYRLPRLPARVARALLAGRSVRSPWIRSWSIVWEAA